MSGPRGQGGFLVARGLTLLTKFRGKPRPFRAAPSIRASKRKLFSKTFTGTGEKELAELERIYHLSSPYGPLR
jgi:hypothetical protein